MRRFILIGSLLALGAGMLTGCSSGGDPSQYREVKVTLKGVRFQPDQMSFKQGEKIRFVVNNADSTVHEFHLLSQRKEWMIHNIEPGTTKSVQVVFTEAGSYDLVCYVANHHLSGMKGQVTVNP